MGKGFWKSLLARYERHGWGYFLETDEKAVAVVGHGENRLRAGLKELARPLPGGELTANDTSG